MATLDENGNYVNMKEWAFANTGQYVDNQTTDGEGKTLHTNLLLDRTLQYQCLIRCLDPSMRP